tara:strand:+ start:3026 stop:3484 length:459 start_codon:yes stop_codon:yes gene_type:complete
MTLSNRVSDFINTIQPNEELTELYVDVTICHNYERLDELKRDIGRIRYNAYVVEPLMNVEQSPYYGERFVGIIETHRNGRPNGTSRIILESEYENESSILLWEQTNRQVCLGLTYEESELVIDQCTYRDADMYQQWNWGYLNGTYPMVTQQV